MAKIKNHKSGAAATVAPKTALQRLQEMEASSCKNIQATLQLILQACYSAKRNPILKRVDFQKLKTHLGVEVFKREQTYIASFFEALHKQHQPAS